MDFEKLGLFYLGRQINATSKLLTDDALLYDSRDLTTHGVCIGMTGSGKTGLCVSLIEEAVIDGIPAVIIDPKGDMANLMLQFPQLRGSDFLPWVNHDAAARKAMSVEDYAEATAQLWRNGLAEWGQLPSRIKALSQSAQFQVLTPGSSAGIPVQLLKSFNAPGNAVLEDRDLFQERLNSCTSSLLALLDIDADPIRSREFILIAKILEDCWAKGLSPGLEDLIQTILAPPFNKVGIISLDDFYPEKDRATLAMSLNNLLASPGFSSWMEGVPLDGHELLYTKEGKPRVSILSIAHLSDSERMFFVTLLLNEMISWMRSQPGTSSLRALLYMDEIFGYFPPTGNPPSKSPMLLLLKQARAFGLGVVLSTQNPVDLDYKGLSNCGTWFIGRLQTDRDKKRILDGLEGVSSEAGSVFDRRLLDTTLSALGSREFLLHNVHDDAPCLFKTRWALSYLAGPMTRDQIKALNQKADLPKPIVQAKDKAPHKTDLKRTTETPAAMRKIPEVFLKTRPGIDEHAQIIYRPALLSEARLHYVKRPADIDGWMVAKHFLPLKSTTTQPEWRADTVLESEFNWTDTPHMHCEYIDLPKAVSNEKSIQAWKKDFVQFLYRESVEVIYTCADPKRYSLLGQSEGDFRLNLQASARESRDLALANLREKYQAKIESVQKQISQATIRLEKEKSQHDQSRTRALISLGTTVLGAVLGRKKVSATNMNRAASTMRHANRTAREKDDVKRVEEQIQELNAQIQELDAACKAELDSIQNKYSIENLVLSKTELYPRKSDIEISNFMIVWQPWLIDEDGFTQPAY
jgi:hypothetical protein